VARKVNYGGGCGMGGGGGVVPRPAAPVRPFEHGSIKKYILK